MRREAGLGRVLLATTLTFLLLHLPRILLSAFEVLAVPPDLCCDPCSVQVATFTRQQRCTHRNLEWLPLNFLYAIAAINLLLVINSSSNIWIYILAGRLFKKNLMLLLCRQSSREKRLSTTLNSYKPKFYFKDMFWGIFIIQFLKQNI